MGAGSDGETADGGAVAGRRRKSAAAAASWTKKKKVAQRGMGVAKLEQQRLEEEWNKMKHQPAVLDPMNMNFMMININPHHPYNLQFHSTELSSTPNSALTFDSQHCNACTHKKNKVINTRNLGSHQICKAGDECGFVGMNFGDNVKEENHVGNGNKGGEIVGVHRKGSAMVMEYDFFPSSNKTKVDDDDDELMMMTSSPISPNWQLDLSLKLSN